MHFFVESRNRLDVSVPPTLLPQLLDSLPDSAERPLAIGGELAKLTMGLAFSGVFNDRFVLNGAGPQEWNAVGAVLSRHSHLDILGVLVVVGDIAVKDERCREHGRRERALG